MYGIVVKNMTVILMVGIDMGGHSWPIPCSVERTTLQLIHKEIVHKKITELNVLYLSEKLILKII